MKYEVNKKARGFKKDFLLILKAADVLWQNQI